MKPAFLPQHLDMTYVNTSLGYYNLPGRSYHNAGHIKRMFVRALAMDLHLSLPQELAILWHDVVYIPGSSGANEKLSVDLMKTFTRSWVMIFDDLNLFKTQANPNLEDSLSQAEQIIIDTITHVPSGEASKLVLDLDLAELSDADRMMENTDDLRVEHLGCFPETKNIREATIAFYEARKAWAAKFSLRDRIYHSSEFASLEQAARNNLKLEIENCNARIMEWG